MRGLDGIDAVVPLKYSGAKVDETRTTVVALDPTNLDRVIDLEGTIGTLDLTPGTTVIGAAEAEALGVEVGDTITMTFPETGEVTLTVTGMLADGPTALLSSPYVVSPEDFAANVTSTLDAVVLISAVEGADLAATDRLLTEALANQPNVTISDPAELTESAQASMDQMLGVVTALLLLAVIVAVLGIVNTLVLSVLERTRELGLMRAVGATRRQIRGIVRRESVLMAMLGASTGVGLGTLSGIALSRALADDGITSVAVPITQLLIYLLVAAAVGVVAAIGPARRASNVDVLRAIVLE